MTKSYYQTPSPLGKQILDLLLTPESYQADCINTIWHLEKLGSSFNKLNAIKYLWRLGCKTADYRDDLEKVIVYILWEISAIQKTIERLESEEDNFFAILLASESIDIYIKIIARCKLLISVYEERKN